MKRSRLKKSGMKSERTRLRVIPFDMKSKGKVVHVGGVGDVKITNNKKDLQIVYVLEEDGEKNWYAESGVQRSDYPLKYAYGKIIRRD
jgi:hypothetical protein